MMEEVKQSETYLANGAHGRSGLGPCWKTAPAVSEKPSDGVFDLLHISCDAFTCKFQPQKSQNAHASTINDEIRNMEAA